MRYGLIGGAVIVAVVVCVWSLRPVPEYTSSKSLDEEPLLIQKDLYIPQRSGNIIGIQKKVLKEAGAAENSFDTEDDSDTHHDMD